MTQMMGSVAMDTVTTAINEINHIFHNIITHGRTFLALLFEKSN